MSSFSMPRSFHPSLNTSCRYIYYIGLICLSLIQCQHSVCYLFTVISSYLEVQGYQGKNEGLQVLNQIVKYSQPFRISRFCNIHQGPNFGCLWVLNFSVAVFNDWIVIWEKTYFEWDMLIAHSDLQFLAPILVLLWPLAVVFPFEMSASCPLSWGGKVRYTSWSHSP